MVSSNNNKYTNNNIQGLKLPQIISSGMVLQQNKELRIWGWAPAGERIKVKFKQQKFVTIADEKSEWVVTIPPQKAGGPYTLMVSGAGSELSIDDIMIGEVWICSGQSNMELPVTRVKDGYEKEIAEAKNDHIRQFKIETAYEFREERADLDRGHWVSADPDSVLDFSAAAYFFARKLYDCYQVPIGLVNAAVGGSPIEAWLSESVLENYPQKLKEASKYTDIEKIKKIQEAEQRQIDSWYQQLSFKDSGLKDGVACWAQPDLDTADWSTINMPSYFSDEGLEDFKGVIWLRKKIYLSEEFHELLLEKKALRFRLQLGTIIDSDTAYINGQKVGETEYRYPPRKYNFSGNLLHPGKNTIAVRVICSKGGIGGFIKDKPYQLELEDRVIDLEGSWKYRVGARVQEPEPKETFFEWLPMGLFKGMISPLTNYKIRGVIWYQGESNVGQADEYKELFPALIEDWRQKWQQESFPFLYVQLPNYGLAESEGTASGWARLREAQLQALTVPQTAMVVAIDLGEWNELHPGNKKDIGERLALAARSNVYGEEITCSGPLYRSLQIKGSKVIIEFNHVNGGLTLRGGDEPRGFTVAGPDGDFVPAKAKILEEKVVVWHEDISQPEHVRYAWADNPEEANLYNQAGLPASPFRVSLHGYKQLD